MYIHQLAYQKKVDWKRKNGQKAQEKATFDTSYERGKTTLGKET